MLSQPQESLAQLIKEKNYGRPGQDKGPLNHVKGGGIEYPPGKLKVRQTARDINTACLHYNLVTVLYPDISPHRSSVISELYHKPNFLAGAFAGAGAGVEVAEQLRLPRTINSGAVLTAGTPTIENIPAIRNSLNRLLS